MIIFFNITNIFDEIRIVRRIKKGVWLKTKKRGWVRPSLYDDYLGYMFDPIVLKEEEYTDKFKKVKVELYIPQDKYSIVVDEDE